MGISGDPMVIHPRDLNILFFRLLNLECLQYFFYIVDFATLTTVSPFTSTTTTPSPGPEIKMPNKTKNLRKHLPDQLFPSKYGLRKKTYNIFQTYNFVAVYYLQPSFYLVYMIWYNLLLFYCHITFHLNAQRPLEPL